MEDAQAAFTYKESRQGEDAEVPEVAHEAQEREQLLHPEWQQLTPYGHLAQEEQEAVADCPITLRFMNGEEVETVVGRHAVGEDLMYLAREHRRLQHLDLLHFKIMYNNKHVGVFTNLGRAGVKAGAVVNVVVVDKVWV